MQEGVAPIADAEEATRIISAEKELALEGLENPMNWSLSRKVHTRRTRCSFQLRAPCIASQSSHPSLWHFVS